MNMNMKEKFLNSMLNVNVKFKVVLTRAEVVDNE